MDPDLDVLIVGAGLSGVGAACHLERTLPGKRYALVETRAAIGGTWDLFRYPGARSDSDMYTLGYAFKPWLGEHSLAAAGEILDYIREAAQEYGVERHIRFGHRVVEASWDSASALWTVTCARAASDDTVTLTCRFLHFCSGYYNYEAGYTPDFPDRERFAGTVVHPQHWPGQLDVRGRRVIVIGSGATAVTLVPALARAGAAHVTMLQRSPSYVLSLSDIDPLAAALRRRCSPALASRIVRLQDIALTSLTYALCRRAPRVARRVLRRAIERQLPAGFDVDRHFTPRYDPWDQRLCIAANGDLFAALRAGDATIVTDTIERFTARGLQLSGGEQLEADVIVTATGLDVELFGGARLHVDGAAVDPGATVAYKGMMFSGVPNLALSVGYTNASWTLKCDLICAYVCRLLAHMDARGYDACVPLEPPAELERRPLLDFSSGYVLRALDRLPRQAERAPWRLHQNWFADRRMFLRGPLADDGIRFIRASGEAGAGAGEPLQSPGCRSRSRSAVAFLTPFATTLRSARSRSRPD